VLRARRNAHVVIVGGTEGGYGAPPASGRSWREILLEEVGGALDMERVHFVGKVPHTVFVDLMRGDRARTPI